MIEALRRQPTSMLLAAGLAGGLLVSGCSSSTKGAMRSNSVATSSLPNTTPSSSAGSSSEASPTTTLGATTSSTQENQTTAANTQQCQAEQVNKWQTTPSNINSDHIAQNLGVTRQRVIDGMFGGAYCAKGFDYNQVAGAQPGIFTQNEVVDKTTAKADDPCLVIGVQTTSNNQPPQPGVIYHHVLAVCAAPES